MIAWHDRRGEAVADRLSARFGPDLDRAIGQRLRYVATVAKLGWLLDDGLAAPPTRWLGVPEIVLRALTGAEATEWSLAARTGCFDVGRREWLPEVAAAAGFGVDVFPPVMGAGEVMGRVTEQAAAWSGLRAGVPVTVGGHDHLVGFVGCGAAADDLVDSVGTAETVVGRSPTLPDVDAALAARHGRHPLSRRRRVGGAGQRRPGRPGDRRRRRHPRPAARRPRPLLAGGTARVLDAPGLRDSLRRRDPPALPEGSPADVWATLLDALATETAAAVDRVTGLLGPRRRLRGVRRRVGQRAGLAAKARRIPMPVERSPVAGAVARGAAPGRRGRRVPARLTDRASHGARVGILPMWRGRP